MGRVQDWSQRVEGDPRLKRKVALLAVVSIAALFGLAVVIATSIDPSVSETSTPRKKTNLQTDAVVDISPDDPDYHRKTAAKRAKSQQEREAKEESARNVKIIVSLVVTFVVIALFLWWSAGLRRKRQDRHLSGDFSESPLAIAFNGFLKLILFFTPPIGWLLLYLWLAEDRRNQDRQIVAEALDELDRRQQALEQHSRRES